MGKKSEESIAISDDSSNFADDLHKGWRKGGQWNCHSAKD